MHMSFWTLWKVKGQKREARTKPASAADKKGSGQSTKKYRLGDEVFVINPRSTQQRVAVGKITGIPGEHKFHCMEIPEMWFKVDILKILHGRTALMYPNERADQSKVEDVKGTCTIWDQKYLKIAV